MSTTQSRLETDIEEQREQVAGPVDALEAKLDVRAQARAHSQQLIAAAGTLVAVAVTVTLWRRVRS